MYLFLLAPALIVIVMASIWRFAIRRNSFGIGGWIVISSLVIFLTVANSSRMGVWLPDVFGKQHTLCTATTSTGYRVSIVQYWNHVDFYTTEARITSPDGVTSISTVDGDASKSWGGTIAIDPSQKGATIRLSDGYGYIFTW